MKRTMKFGLIDQGSVRITKSTNDFDSTFFAMYPHAIVGRVAVYHS